MKSIFVLSLLALYVCATPTGFMKKPKERIFNGLDAEEGQFPYQVYIRFPTFPKPALAGLAGAILSKDWVITIGYFLRKTHYAQIQAGSNFRSTYDQNKVTVEAEDIFVSNNSVNKGFNDIALIKLKTPLTFNAFIQPIGLQKEEVKEGTVLTISGWGAITTSSYPTLTNTLQYIGLKVVSEEECEKFDGYLFDEFRMCAKSTTSRIKQSCDGDQGNPLVFYSGPQQLLVGVAMGFNFQDRCGMEHRASGFIKVYKYVNWIQNITGLYL